MLLGADLLTELVVVVVVVVVVPCCCCSLLFSFRHWKRGFGEQCIDDRSTMFEPSAVVVGEYKSVRANNARQCSIVFVASE